jgi:hypothetical protein
MGRIRKYFLLLFVFLLVFSFLTMANPAYSELSPTPTASTAPTASANQLITPTPTAPNTTPQPTPNLSSIKKPSVPEFSVNLVEGPYDIPSSYVINAFNGQNITIPAVHIDKRAIVVTIKNQPFTPYHDANSDSNISFYYNVRAKLHSLENWTIQYATLDSGGFEDVPVRTDSEYTNIVYYMNDESTNTYSVQIMGLTDGFSSDAKVDFQVQALEGYITRVFIPPFLPYRFFGQTSDWSNTQTITIFGEIPNISIFTPQNLSYSTSDVPLIFGIDKPVSQIKYNLDNQGNVTIEGNSTLTKLSSGVHNITIYAVDKAGNAGVSMSYFTISKVFPKEAVALSGIIVILVVVVAGLLVYFKKHKHNLVKKL